MQNCDLSYSNTISVLKDGLNRKRRLETEIKKLRDSLVESQTEYVKMIDAQKILSTVSDENTKQTLDFITGMVNKVLHEVFPNDDYHIKLHKKLFAGSKPHIVVELIDADGNSIDLSIQTGDGLNQIVSFMYVMCLIEIRKGRRIIIMDEKLNGLHQQAKNYISDIIEIFAKSGFQFIFVEYNLNNLGKIYNVEKHGRVSTLVNIENDEYSNDCVYFDDVDLSVLDEDYVDEESGIDA